MIHRQSWIQPLPGTYREPRCHYGLPTSILHLFPGFFTTACCSPGTTSCDWSRFAACSPHLVASFPKLKAPAGEGGPLPSVCNASSKGKVVRAALSRTCCPSCLGSLSLAPSHVHMFFYQTQQAPTKTGLTMSTTSRPQVGGNRPRLFLIVSAI